MFELCAFARLAQKLHGWPKRKNAEISHLQLYRQG
jgi:hypothetical protein